MQMSKDKISRRYLAGRRAAVRRRAAVPRRTAVARASIVTPSHVPPSQTYNVVPVVPVLLL
jgi:carbonic anhydrase/acetyltransferase-like protein (isoleucine patch superfamily)